MKYMRRESTTWPQLEKDSKKSDKVDNFSWVWHEKFLKQKWSNVVAFIPVQDGNGKKIVMSNNFNSPRTEQNFRYSADDSVKSIYQERFFMKIWVEFDWSLLLWSNWQYITIGKDHGLEHNMGTSSCFHEQLKHLGPDSI